MPPSTFSHTHRVTYAECTLGNHVYYARYLDMLEKVRGEFFRVITAPLLELQAADTIFPVVECRLSYKAPARYDDLLTITLRVTKLQTVRLNFGYWVQCGEKLICEAETAHVCTSISEKPKRIPAHLSALLKAFCVAEEMAYDRKN